MTPHRMLLHERWFTDDWKFPVQYDKALTARTWIPLGVAIGVTALAMIIWRARGRRPLQVGGHRPEAHRARLRDGPVVQADVVFEAE